LAAILTSLNLLAFLGHTALGWLDEPYRLVRARLASRQTFFDYLRAQPPAQPPLSKSELLTSGPPEFPPPPGGFQG